MTVERQNLILETVVEEYIKNVFPISSDYLKQECDLDVCSSTIRLDLAELTGKGYLEKPHTSSGRVPTDKGYRFFVDSLKRKQKKSYFNNFFKEVENQIHLFQLLTENLAHLSAGLSIIQNEDIFWKEGWEEIVKIPEFQDMGYFKDFLELVKEFEKKIDLIDVEKEVKVFIGKEIPFKEKNFSMIVSKSKDCVFAILGPKRMDFKKNIALMDSLLDAFK